MFFPSISTCHTFTRLLILFSLSKHIFRNLTILQECVSSSCLLIHGILTQDTFVTYINMPALKSGPPKRPQGMTGVGRSTSVGMTGDRVGQQHYV